MNQDEVRSRIRDLVKESGKTQAEFARALGIDAPNFSKYLTGRLPLTDALLNRFVVEFRISKDWLKTGCGPVRNLVERKSLGAPVYDIDITAGQRELSRELVSERVVGFVDMPGVDPSLPLVRISGDSMQPVIIDGALVSVRQVSLSNEIFWGQIYVVVLDDYRMVKYVRRCHDNSDKVVLHSANTSYDDMEISRDSIRNLLLVETILNVKKCY